MAGAGRGGADSYPAVLTIRHSSNSGDMEVGSRRGVSSSSVAAAAELEASDEEAGAAQPLLGTGGGDRGGGGSGSGMKLTSRGVGGDDGADSKAGSAPGGSGKIIVRPAAAGPKSTFNARRPAAAWLDSLSPNLKFAIMVGCVMVTFGLHNILQEKIFKIFRVDDSNSNFGWSLGLLEAVGVLAGSMLERAHSGEVGKRVAPFSSYLVLAGLLGMSSSLSNMALKYIQYPTKVIFRSCKLIPTMVIAVLWRKKIVSRSEFLAAFAVCAGLIIFGLADAKLEPDFDFRGIAMVLTSVCADAFLPNMQEHVLSMGASRVEVTYFTNCLTVIGMLVSTGANGNLWTFLGYAVRSGSAAAYMLVYCLLSHVAIASHMTVLKEYGGVTAVLVGNTRKAMTIGLSFLLFPKPFSYQFVLGGALVLGGLAANVMIKERRKGAGAASKSHNTLVGLGAGDAVVTSGIGGDGGGRSSKKNGGIPHARTRSGSVPDNLHPWPSLSGSVTAAGSGDYSFVTAAADRSLPDAVLQNRNGLHPYQHNPANGHPYGGPT